MRSGVLSKVYFPDYTLPDKPDDLDRKIQNIINANGEVVRMSAPMMKKIVEHSLKNKDLLEISALGNNIINTPRNSMLWLLTSASLHSMYLKKLRYMEADDNNKLFSFQEEELQINLDKLGSSKKTIALGTVYHLSNIALVIKGDYYTQLQLTKELFEFGDLLEKLFPIDRIIAGKKNILTIRGNNLLNRELRTSNQPLENMLVPSFQIQRLHEDDSVIQGARAIIKENIANADFNLIDLARLLCVSPRTLQRKLKQENTSFVELRNKERIDLIVQRLAMGETKENLYELVGYKDIRSIHKLLAKVEKQK